MTSAAPERRSPYQGLIPYSEDDAPFFFGREKETRLIIANLFASPLTLLYGASGVGKSSVLRAGVVNGLRAREDVLAVVVNSWQTDALTDFKAAVAKAAARVRREPLDVPDASSLSEFLAACAAQLGRRLMIILDQFEEYFLYHPQDDAFAAEFPKAVMQPDAPVSFLISLREDSLASLDRFEGRIPTLFDNYLRIEHLDTKAARAAIEKPIEHYNSLQAEAGQAVQIEPGLVEEVLRQVEAGQVLLGEAGRGVIRDTTSSSSQIETPYLQLVMMRLWNEELKAGSRVLRLQTLNALGGAKRIVRTHLDASIGALPAKEQHVAASIFHYLVTPSGTKIAHTARDLADYAALPQTEITAVLEDLSGGDVRILRSVDPPPDQPSTPRYEIFHDVLASAILDWRSRYVVERVRERSRRKRRLYIGVTLLVFAIAAAVGSYLHWRTVVEAQKDKENLERAKNEEHEKREEFEEDFSEVALTYRKTVALLEDLSGDDPVQQQFAIENITRLAEEGRLPPALAPAIRELIEKKNPAQAKRVYETIRATEKNEHALDADQDLDSLSPIVFLQITNESERPNAKQLEGELESQGFSVPAVERVNHGPSHKELRFFRKTDEREAAAIVNKLNGMGWSPVRLTYVPGYENTKVIRPRQYEFWFEDTQHPVDVKGVVRDEIASGQVRDALAPGQSGGGEMSIIAGAFPAEKRGEADARLKLLQQNGFQDATLRRLRDYPKAGETTWRVTLGPYSVEQSRDLLPKVRSVVPDAYERSLAKPEYTQPATDKPQTSRPAQNPSGAEPLRKKYRQP